MTEQRTVSPEEFIQMSKLESLATQNAQQALRISELEAQVKYLNIRLQEHEGTSNAEEVAEAEDEEPLMN